MLISSLFLSMVYLVWKFVQARDLKRFFAKAEAAAGPGSPAVDMVQPITRGACGLRENLLSRLEQRYGGPLRHHWVLDAGDAASLKVCQEVRRLFPEAEVELVLVESPSGQAMKIDKMLAALPGCASPLLCFIDDDIGLLPDSLALAAGALLAMPHPGASFGLPMNALAGNLPTRMLSAFVNSSAFPSYAGYALRAEPYTITGHFFVMKRAGFEQVGGLDGMQGRFDDDHELARRLRAAGLGLCQSAARYHVRNHMDDWAALRGQLKRWFTMPKLAMTAYLQPAERRRTALLSAPSLIPPAALALGAFSGLSWAVFSILFFVLANAFAQRRTRRHFTPEAPRVGALEWLWVLFVLPLRLALVLAFSDGKVAWRGKRLALGQGGGFREL